MTTARTRHRILTFALITALLTAFPVGLRAQDDRADDQRTMGLVKIIIGASAAVSGALLAANSGESAEITASDQLFGSTTIRASTRSTGKMVLGLGLLGTGGGLIWWGARDRRQAAQPSSNLTLQAGPGQAGVVFSRVW